MFRLPNINARTDSGKIVQLQDYLFQLVRQMNMEQERYEESLSNSRDADELMQIHPVDVPVEQGTSGIWTYRKWASGLAECWGEYTNSDIKFNTEWENVYVSQINKNRIDYPFTFKSRPKEFVNLRCGTYSATLYSESLGKGINNTMQTGIYCGKRPVLTDVSSSVTLDFYVIGRWK